jgi:hypothetical protein
MQCHKCKFTICTLHLLLLLLLLLLLHADAEWPEPLLLHKSTCLDTAATLDFKRRQRQERWQMHMQRAAGGNSTTGPDGPQPAGDAAGGSAPVAAGEVPF